MRIACLADFPDAIPEIAGWFYREWSYLHPGRTLEDVRCAVGERVNRDTIPLALVAIDDTASVGTRSRAALVGTVCLKLQDMDTRTDLSPWLAGLYVEESRRGLGIGTALVEAIERKAGGLGIRTLYLYTPSAASFYLRLGWRIEEAVEYHSAHVTIMKKEIAL